MTAAAAPDKTRDRKTIRAVYNRLLLSSACGGETDEGKWEPLRRVCSVVVVVASQLADGVRGRTGILCARAEEKARERSRQERTSGSSCRPRQDGSFQDQDGRPVLRGGEALKPESSVAGWQGCVIITACTYEKKALLYCCAVAVPSSLVDHCQFLLQRGGLAGGVGAGAGGLSLIHI